MHRLRVCPPHVLVLAAKAQKKVEISVGEIQHVEMLELLHATVSEAFLLFRQNRELGTRVCGDKGNESGKRVESLEVDKLVVRRQRRSRYKRNN